MTMIMKYTTCRDITLLRVHLEENKEDESRKHFTDKIVKRRKT